MMKHKLMILLSLCCFCGAMTTSFAADNAAKKAAAEQQKAKIEAEKKAAAEKKKQKELAERQAREAARKNSQDAKALADKFRSAMKSEKFDEAVAVSKDAMAMLDKPGVPDMGWFAANFTSYDLAKAKAPVRAKAIPVLVANYKTLLPKMTGDQKVAALSAYMAVLAYDLPANEKEIAQVKAARYKVKDTTPLTTLRLYIADWEFEKADSFAKAMKFEDKEKGYADIVAAFQASGIPGCQYTKAWFEKWIAIPATGDVKYKKNKAYADFLEEYALASMAEVDKMRQDLDKINDLSKEFAFKVACDRIDNTKPSAVYQANLKKALDLAKGDVNLRIKVYYLTISNGHNVITTIPDKAQMKDFLLNVVFKDKEAMADNVFAGKALTAYVQANFMNFQETESFLLKYQTAENKTAVTDALLALYKIASVRYYNGTNVQIAKKILAIYQERLKEAQAKSAAEKSLTRKGDIEFMARKNVIEWAFLAKDLKTVRETLDGLAQYPNASFAEYITVTKASLAFQEERYDDVVKILLPNLNQEKKRWPPETYEQLVRSLVATGNVKLAAEVMEKNINNFPRWRIRNYYQPRMEALKKRAENAPEKK